MNDLTEKVDELYVRFGGTVPRDEIITSLLRTCAAEHWHAMNLHIKELEAELAEVASWWEMSGLAPFLPETWELPDPATTPTLRALVDNALDTRP